MGVSGGGAAERAGNPWGKRGGHGRGRRVPRSLLMEPPSPRRRGISGENEDGEPTLSPATAPGNGPASSRNRRREAAPTHSFASLLPPCPHTHPHASLVHRRPGAASGWIGLVAPPGTPHPRHPLPGKTPRKRPYRSLQRLPLPEYPPPGRLAPRGHGRPHPPSPGQGPLPRRLLADRRPGPQGTQGWDDA